ncbi:hypothetical protein E8E12_001992 [Didymella heteroderae]|uniref:Uncharacterized protein n=1 Tax=Didymella heteroderae TaxID=1769908 RepID=A0A9P4WLB1_9PLEO|nr:hypothetical protein E8E12_001992 [Didymella heteroderae]
MATPEVTKREEALYKAALVRMENAFTDRFPRLIDRLEKIKHDIDRVIDLGIEDIRCHKAYSYVRRVGDLTTPTPVDKFVDDIHKIRSVEDMRAKWAVQSKHFILLVAEQASMLMGRALGFLDALGEKRPSSSASVTLEDIGALQSFAVYSREILAEASKLYVEAAIEIMGRLDDEQEADVAISNHSRRLLERFAKKSDKERADRLSRSWASLTSGSISSREVSIQRRKAHEILAMLRWASIEALDKPRISLQTARTDIDAMREALAQTEDSEDEG